MCSSLSVPTHELLDLMLNRNALDIQCKHTASQFQVEVNVS